MPDVSTWTSKQVYRWAIDDVQVAERHAQRLVDNEVSGETFLEQTEERLSSLRDPWRTCHQTLEGHTTAEARFILSFISPFTLAFYFAFTYLLTHFKRVRLSPDFGRYFLRVMSNSSPLTASLSLFLPDGLEWLTEPRSELFIRPARNIYDIVRSRLNGTKGRHHWHSRHWQELVSMLLPYGTGEGEEDGGLRVC